MDQDGADGKKRSRRLAEVYLVLVYETSVISWFECCLLDMPMYRAASIVPFRVVLANHTSTDF